MGKMKELLDQRLDENKYEMLETLRILRDKGSSHAYAAMRLARILKKIEEL